MIKFWVVSMTRIFTDGSLFPLPFREEAMVFSPYVFIYIYITWPYKNTARGIFQDILMSLNGLLPGTLASNAFKLLERGIILKSFNSLKYPKSLFYVVETLLASTTFLFPPV